MQTREIQLRGTIDDAVANDVIAKLLFLSQQDPQRPIVLVLNSPGGSATAGLAIMDTMQFVAAPVHVIAREVAGGMALLLLIAGCPGHRSATPQTLLHNSPIVITSTTPNAQEYLSRLNAKLQEHFTTLTKLTATEAKDAVESGRTFSVEEALSLGIIDAIVPSP
jgi:ATP-dependent Clp protease protease subunit